MRAVGHFGSAVTVSSTK